jgi:threonine/homoserine/homoserine lactone efflux protein
MNTLVGVGWLIFISAVTPGPNNIAVLQIAGERGLKAAAAAITGIVVGGFALVLLIQAGLGAVAARHEWLRGGITLGGAAYLAWLGATIVHRGFSSEDGTRDPARKDFHSAWSLFTFQFTNPKAWILVLTATAVARCSGCSNPGPMTALAVLMTVIPATCLLGWALLGRVVARHAQGAAKQAWLARSLGLLLIAAAASLALP